MTNLAHFRREIVFIGMRYFHFRLKTFLGPLGLSLFILAAACSPDVLCEGAAPLPPLAVTALDVGQGLAVLLECGGRHALYDAGPDSAGLRDSLAARGIDTLEWVLVSHYHRDHAGGFWELGGGADAGSAGLGADCAGQGLSRTAPQVHVRRLLVSPDTSGGFVRDSVLATAHRLSVPVDTLLRGASFGGNLCGDLPESPSPRFDVLWPPAYVREGGNPASVVVRVEYGAGSALLTGDLDSLGERRLLELSPTLSADLLQVAHHGSAGSSSLRFVAQVAPEYAVVSMGAENRYGHPAPAVVNKLGYVLGDTAWLFRTDIDGSVRFELWPELGVVAAGD